MISKRYYGRDRQLRRLFILISALLLSLTLTLTSCAIPTIDTDQQVGQDIVSEATTVSPDQTTVCDSQGDTAAETDYETDPIPSQTTIDESGTYTTKDDVALYIRTYGHLPGNFITKKEAEKLGWSGGSLEPYAPGKCIGGSNFGNYEGLLPESPGRIYKECDIDTLGAKKRGAKRIVYSNDGLIYYTDDHYESFVLLYGEE